MIRDKLSIFKLLHRNSLNQKIFMGTEKGLLCDPVYCSSGSFKNILMNKFLFICLFTPICFSQRNYIPSKNNI